VKHILTWAIILSSPGLAAAAEAKLKVGDKAPPLSIQHWLRGKPVTPATAKAEDVFVVEFWATWCRPCHASAPQLSKMQETFKDRGVTVIGISNEGKQTVEAFLKGGFDARMRYTIALDDNNKTNRAWMLAAGRMGIPAAFIVKGGTIRWIGDPRSGLYLKIAELCGDTDYPKRIARMRKLGEDFQNAARAEKWSTMVEIADEMLDMDPLNIGVQLAKYHLLIVKLGKISEAAKFGRAIVAGCNDPDNLHVFAYQTLTNPDFSKARDFELAIAAAQKAMKLTEHKDPGFIVTYARSLADSGDLKGAIEWQEKAVNLGRPGRMLRDLQRSLDDYRKRAKAETKG